jgi:hypothetical protein
MTISSKSKAVINSHSAPRALPDSVVRWVGSSEAQQAIRAALEAAARSNAEYDQYCIVPRESLDRPLSTI